MLESEINKWQWAITWDNALPANSSGMHRALARLGKLTKLHTKTAVILAPKASVTVKKIRRTIEANLNQLTGNAVYVNLRTKNAFQYHRRTKYAWKRMNP
jgi:hypothetical protein